MTIRICIAGATGHVGQELVKAILASSDLELTSGVSRKHAGEALMHGSVVEALKAAPADVFIDYTHPDAVKGNLLAAIAAGCHAVVGTSGLTDADYAEIDAAAAKRGVGVFAAGNFSLTA